MPAKAKAAQSENGKRSVEWRGLTLALPAGDPPARWARHFGTLEDGKKAISPILSMIEQVLGNEQYEQVWDKLEEDGLSATDAIEEVAVGDEGLFSLILDEFGMSLGESPASSDS